MIILEGPDGGGKTTLMEELLVMYPSLQRHDRASNGVHGPINPLPVPGDWGLFDWAKTDVDTWGDQPMSAYDRHPFVSEYIYGPTTRNAMDSRFYTTDRRRTLARTALTIVCLPPLNAVRRAVSAERDMPGVTTHIDTIWQLYASLTATWPVTTGLEFYDYTQPNLDRLHAAIRHHLSTWRFRVER